MPPAPPPGPVPSVSPAEARRRLAEQPGFVLLDVREPEEVALAAVPGALTIPMHTVPLRLAEIPRTGEVAVLCHHGVRSWHVAQALRAHGWTNVVNVSGGIDAWSVSADPSIPRYA